MANNPYINKISYGDQTLIDLTADTVAANTLLSGYTAHDASGAIVTGTIQAKTQNDVTIDGTEVNVIAGYYPSVNKNIDGIQLTVPESNTHDFYIDFPDTIAPASASDWSRIVFSVDDEGNSTVTDSQMNLIAAEEVSF